LDLDLEMLKEYPMQFSKDKNMKTDKEMYTYVIEISLLAFFNVLN